MEHVVGADRESGLELEAEEGKSAYARLQDESAAKLQIIAQNFMKA